MKIFRLTEVRDLLVSVWAIRVIALNQADAAQRFMRLPRELIGAEIGSQHYVAPWILETLTNEGFVHTGYNVGRKKIDLTQFNNFSAVYNVMNELENAESLMDIPEGGISRALPRLGWRQFEWQETFFKERKIYRSWRLYTVPEAATYFEQKHRIRPDRATAVGFLLFSEFLSNPAIDAKVGSSDWEISEDEIATVLSFISNPVAAVKNRTRQLRSKRGEAAYKPSVLRETPLISMRYGGRKKYYSPLPDLCLQRLCDGLYQDVVDNQSVMQKVAAEFENYSFDIFTHYCGSHFQVFSEAEYGPKGQRVLTPDLRIADAKKTLRVIIECKRRLLPYKIVSSVNPTRQYPNLYEDFVKGVQQIWRYASKVRRGIADDNWTIDDNTVGLVLTLHPWMLLSGEAVQWIKERARSTLKAEWQVTEIDLIPVSFTHSDDLEVSMFRLPIAQLPSALARHAREDRIGYSFRHVAEDFYSDIVEILPFDYDTKIVEHVKWWGDMRAAFSG